jgi:hypothetical protein
LYWLWFLVGSVGDELLVPNVLGVSIFWGDAPVEVDCLSLRIFNVVYFLWLWNKCFNALV